MSLKCLINAGPTREYFDAVRFISNPSSGKFGCALAKAALAKKWNVSLVLGPCSPDLSSLQNAKITKVVSAEDMYKACKREFDDCDIFIASAAVCDMKPKISFTHKVKKSDISNLVEFEPTIDVLKTISKDRRANQFLAGFAAETDNIKDYALKKLSEKNLDCVIANDVSCGKAFEQDSNSVCIYFKNGNFKLLPLDTKENLAKKIIDIIEETYLKNAPAR